MNKLRLAILKNELEYSGKLWIRACRERAAEVEWDVVELTRSDWLERVSGKAYDGLLASPSALTNPFKQLYDERVRILHSVLGIPVYPSLCEIEIYENKRYLSYWLAANGIPHPRTWVFYYADEAIDFVTHAILPLVGKTSIGASGRGVIILHAKDDAVDYIKKTFSGKGASKSIGPRWDTKGLLRRVIHGLLHPHLLKAKLREYRRQYADLQNSFVILQAYVPHNFEWRCVRIGESFFAHKKLKKHEKASGTLLKNYDDPPLELMDFIKHITDKTRLSSLAIDLFEPSPGIYLVNEMQCIFGQSDPYQMLVNGQMGRYRFLQGKWVFEPGDFNRIESFELRLDHFITLIRQK